MRLAIPVVLFLLAVWMGWAQTTTAPIGGPAAEFDPAALSTEPLRPAAAEPATIVVGGIRQRCSDCHAIFPSAQISEQTLRQHEHVVLDHGLNDRCLNCHARSDRNSLELHDGRLVPLAEAQELCAKCHGPTFRDWEKGTHGRTNGSWVVGSPAMHRLTCTECHDPHAPAMRRIVPLPGPNTWRMGDPGAPAEATHASGPLGRFGLAHTPNAGDHVDG